MIFILLYHHIAKKNCPYSNNLKIFQEHLQYLKDHYPLVIPSNNFNYPIQICLSFDDAYFDFYAYAFPLLEKMRIPFLLSIPTHFILPSTTISYEKRLSVPADTCFKNNYHLDYAPFCTWEEIKTMHNSSLLYAASHTHTHADLTQDNVVLEKEIVLSKQFIEKNLAIPIDTFVYPYGKFNDRVHRYVKQHYRYIMRIGSTFNLSWRSSNQLLYRICADQLSSVSSLFSFHRYVSYSLKYFCNKIRKR